MEEFKQKRKRQIILVLIAVPVALIYAFFDRTLMPWGIPQQLIQGFMVLVILSLAIFSFINWRCPSCKKFLGKGINPKFCSGCGVKLQD